MILSKLKEPFLEFLRNLTPQILLLSIALVQSTKLDLKKFDVTNFWGTLPFLLVIAVFIAAMLANMFVFMEKSVKSIQVVDSRSQELHAQNIKGTQHLSELFKTLWSVKKALAIELIAVALVIEIGMSAVFIGAIPAASTLYEVTHSSKQNASTKS